MANYGSGTYSLLGVAGTVTATVDPNATVVFNLTGVLSTFVISSNTGSSVTINNTVNIADNLTLDTNGGTIVIGTLAGGLGVVNATIGHGGTFVAGSTAIGLINSGTITYSTGGGTALLGTSSDFVNLTFAPVIDNFTSTADRLDNESLKYSGFQSYTISGTSTGTQTITITDTSGNFTFSTNDAGLQDGTYTSLTSGPLLMGADGAGGITIAPCFCAGTRIRTPWGESRVEDLRIGDEVVTAFSGVQRINGSVGAIMWGASLPGIAARCRSASRRVPWRTVCPRAIYGCRPTMPFMPMACWFMRGG